MFKGLSNSTHFPLLHSLKMQSKSLLQGLPKGGIWHFSLIQCSLDLRQSYWLLHEISIFVTWHVPSIHFLPIFEHSRSLVQDLTDETSAKVELVNKIDKSRTLLNTEFMLMIKAFTNHWLIHSLGQVMSSYYFGNFLRLHPCAQWHLSLRSLIRPVSSSLTSPMNIHRFAHFYFDFWYLLLTNETISSSMQ